MSMKLKATILASSLAILLFTLVGGFVNVRASSNDGAYRQLSVYSEVLRACVASTLRNQTFRW